MAIEALKSCNDLRINKIYLPFTSRGILHIFFNLVYLRWKTRNAEGLFHITGDVHYSVLVLPAQRTILTIHDLVFLHTYRGLTRKILKWLYLDLPISKALHITTISEKSKKEILDHSACEPNNITIIPDPIDPRFTTVQTSSLTPGISSLDFPPSSFNILFLGTKSNKNLERSIPALYQLPVHLRIIGELEMRQKKLLQKFKIHYSNVYSITEKALLQEYSNTDLVLFPSTYEGFGLPVLEAFATGKAVITSDISPMNAVAGNAALLVNPYSIGAIRKGVQQLIGDPSLCDQLSKVGRKRVLDFLLVQIFDQYNSIWKKIASNPG